jgi:hypothetical protein
MLVTILASAVLGTAALPPPRPQDVDYIYCTAQDGSRQRIYYSAVFAGDYHESRTYEQAFRAHLTARYTRSLTNSLCFYESSRRDAQVERDDKAASDRGRGWDVSFTRWAG